jgi:hypothetical protein
MKYLLFVALTFMLAPGGAWSHGFRGNYGPSPYAGSNSPYNPHSFPNRLNASPFHQHGPLYHRSGALNAAPNFNAHSWQPPYAVHTRRREASIYTPYSSPYGIHRHRFASEFENPFMTSPYSSGWVVNPYGIYPNPYLPSPVFSPYFQNWIDR